MAEIKTKITEIMIEIIDIITEIRYNDLNAWNNDWKN